jgi:hypothetical protein
VIRLPGEVRREPVFPVIAPDALECLNEVIVPEELTRDGARDAQAAAYGEAQRLAGADCRAKLDSLRALVTTWPRP